MEIEAHDVSVDGIFSVCARASAKRFKILRLVQFEPYIIVDMPSTTILPTHPWTKTSPKLNNAY